MDLTFASVFPNTVVEVVATSVVNSLTADVQRKIQSPFQLSWTIDVLGGALSLHESETKINAANVLMGWLKLESNSPSPLQHEPARFLPEIIRLLTMPFKARNFDVDLCRRCDFCCCLGCCC